MKEKLFVAPTLNADAFHCPHCEVYAHQSWYESAKWKDNSYHGVVKGSKNLSISVCTHCGDYALWLDKAIIYPASSIAPMPAADMPQDVKEDYVEARNIVNI